MPVTLRSSSKPLKPAQVRNARTEAPPAARAAKRRQEEKRREPIPDTAVRSTTSREPQEDKRIASEALADVCEGGLAPSIWEMSAEPLRVSQ